MHVQPYLSYEGRCDEALEFYKGALGAEVKMLMRFKECPDKNACSPGSLEKVMHCSVQIGKSEVFMTDGRCSGNAKFEGISLSIATDSVADNERLFAALGTGGKVTMPLSKTFFAKSFGMVADKFGVHWMLICGAQ